MKNINKKRKNHAGNKATPPRLMVQHRSRRDDVGRATERLAKGMLPVPKRIYTRASHNSRYPYPPVKELTLIRDSRTPSTPLI